MDADRSSLACPTCGRAVPMPRHLNDASATFPFCSPRCRVRDLGAWADGRHAIPGPDLHELLDDPQVDRP